ncbi:MAG: undecaprenyl/decaprenyl-phosphate alpha-N-acetylglucosaminyl 1-phosphate transferase [Chloroflexota bacterium]|nr:undecaprenyl/decaprenyl-phosphate alpha-N-acetylglucosaminyl 1-phosphate transferase [Chloroflexota bacterium]
MSRPVISAIIFIATLGCTVFFVWQVRRIAVRLGLFGRMGDRHLHTRAIPRLGGVAIFLGFCIGVALSFALPVTRFPIEVARIVLMLVAGMVIFFVMLADDLVELPALPRLLWQFGAAALVVLPRLRGPSSGIVIDSVPNPFHLRVTESLALPLAVAIPFTLLWIVGMTNAINWIDGVDGLSSGIVFIASAVLFVHTYFRPPGNPQFTISLLPLALGAAVLGFLPFNWHPSRIIMGDCGAMFLGFALAVASIIGGAKIATTLLVLVVPLLNIAWVILDRLRHGANPMRADRRHLHDRLLDAGWTQRQVVTAAYTICALFGAIALLFDKRVKFYVFSAMAAVLVVALVILVLRGPPGTKPRSIGGGDRASRPPEDDVPLLTAAQQTAVRRSLGEKLEVRLIVGADPPPQ